MQILSILDNAESIRIERMKIEEHKIEGEKKNYNQCSKYEVIV
jgi:hypothetical protein